MDLSINPMMIALQAVPFLLTLMALHAIIFKPMLAYLEAREAAIANGRKEAERLNADAAEKIEALERQLTASRANASQHLAQGRAKAQAELEGVLSAARAEAESTTTAAVAALRADAELARAQLSSTTQDLATRVTAAVLGRSVANG